MNEPVSKADELAAVGSPAERGVRPRAWWRLSIYPTCDPCVTVREDEAAFWRSEGLTVVELGDVAAERDPRAVLQRALLMAVMLPCNQDKPAGAVRAAAVELFGREAVNAAMQAWGPNA